MLLNLSYKSGQMHPITAIREVIAIALLFLFSINNEGGPSSKGPGPAEVSHSVLAPKFDVNSMRFAGSPESQARYLLRHVYFEGVLGDSLTSLPPFFDSLMTDLLPVISRDELRHYIG